MHILKAPIASIDKTPEIISIPPAQQIKEETHKADPKPFAEEAEETKEFQRLLLKEKKIDAAQIEEITPKPPITFDSAPIEKEKVAKEIEKKKDLPELLESDIPGKTFGRSNTYNKLLESVTKEIGLTPVAQLQKDKFKLKKFLAEAYEGVTEERQDAFDQLVESVINNGIILPKTIIKLKLAELLKSQFKGITTDSSFRETIEKVISLLSELQSTAPKSIPSIKIKLTRFYRVAAKEAGDDTDKKDALTNLTSFLKENQFISKSYFGKETVKELNNLLRTKFTGIGAALAGKSKIRETIAEVLSLISKLEVEDPRSLSRLKGRIRSFYNAIAKKAKEEPSLQRDFEDLQYTLMDLGVVRKPLRQDLYRSQQQFVPTYQQPYQPSQIMQPGFAPSELRRGRPQQPFQQAAPYPPASRPAPTSYVPPIRQQQPIPSAQQYQVAPIPAFRPRATQPVMPTIPQAMPIQQPLPPSISSADLTGLGFSSADIDTFNLTAPTAQAYVTPLSPMPMPSPALDLAMSPVQTAAMMPPPPPPLSPQMAGLDLAQSKASQAITKLQIMLNPSKIPKPGLLGGLGPTKKGYEDLMEDAAKLLREIANASQIGGQMRQFLAVANAYRTKSRTKEFNELLSAAYQKRLVPATMHQRFRLRSMDQQFDAAKKMQLLQRINSIKTYAQQFTANLQAHIIPQQIKEKIVNEFREDIYTLFKIARKSLRKTPNKQIDLALMQLLQICSQEPTLRIEAKKFRNYLQDWQKEKKKRLDTVQKEIKKLDKRMVKYRKTISRYQSNPKKAKKVRTARRKLDTAQQQRIKAYDKLRLLQ